MTFETLTDVFAVIGVGACVWRGAVLVGRLLGRGRRTEIAPQEAEAAAGRDRPPSAPLSQSTPVEEVGGVAPDHVVAIAAAVAACGYRVVHIADPAGGSAWVSEGRWIHQTSHRTH